MSRLIAFTVTLLFAGSTNLAANERAVSPTPKQAVGRVLTRTEGAALVDRTLQHRATLWAPDCSHLIHQVFTAAGLAYPYATSFEIFSGIPQFRRVNTAQPGDLIVWPGHVGLVVDPEQRTFFSRTGSGPSTHEYDSDYWRSRGHPRFYRYIVGGTAPSLSAPPVHIAKATMPDSAAPPESSSESSDAFDTAPADVSSSVRSDQIPETIQVLVERGRPAKEDVEEALSELANASASALGTEQHRKLSVMLVRELRVEKIQIKGEKGWAEVRVDSRAELGPDLIWKRARSSRIRWELRKNQDGWILSAPTDRLYVPQSAAIPLLAKQLSTLSAKPVPATRQDQLGSLAALLNFLLNEN